MLERPTRPPADRRPLPEARSRSRFAPGRMRSFAHRRRTRERHVTQADDTGDSDFLEVGTAALAPEPDLF